MAWVKRMTFCLWIHTCTSSEMYDIVHHSIAILHNFMSYCGKQFEVDGVLTRDIAAVYAIISFWGSFVGFYSK